MTRSANAQRVAKHRESLRAQGLRPVQIWVPDTRAAGFAEECAHQTAIVAAADRADPELIAFLDASADELLADLDAAEAAEAGDAV